jgi:hypothetical protein
MSRVSGCTLCILFLLFAVSPPSRADIWLGKQSQLQRLAPDGHVVRTVAEAYGRPIIGIEGIDMLAVDQSDGSVYTIDGGVPPPDDPPAFGIRRVLKVSQDGAPQFETVLKYCQGLAVDRGRGGVWVSVSLNDEETARDVLFLDAATGAIRARIHGFQDFVGHMTVGTDGALWVADWSGSNDNLVRLDGSLEELDGYDAAAAVGDHHERLTNPARPSQSPIVVNPADGDVWVADRDAAASQGQLVELSAAGDELQRVTPGFFAIGQLAIDARDGSIWAADDRSEGKLAHFSALGQELARLEQWDGVGPIAADMTDESLWSKVYPVIDPEWGDGPSELVKLDARGTVLLTIPDADDTLSLAAFAAGPSTVEIDLDIAPWDRHNLVNPHAPLSLVNVAILSSATFDPLQIDPRSLRFGTAGAVAKAHWTRDVNRDGVADMVVAFNAAHAGLKCGDTEATLTGATYAGATLHGVDAIRTVGCGRPDWHRQHVKGLFDHDDEQWRNAERGRRTD